MIQVTERPGGNLMMANAQWSTRPSDERFLDLATLKESVANRAPARIGGAGHSQEKVFPLATAKLASDKDDLFMLGGPNNDTRAKFTNWSFGQYNRLIGGPDMRWLRDMPAPIVRDTLEATVKFRGTVTPESDAKLYLTPPVKVEDTIQDGELRAFTSPTYGRIYDLEVVNAVERINSDGRWSVPLQAYGGINSKLATTLYASDRDVWLFLVDENHPIDIAGSTLFRGFIAYNSEVGAQTFGLITFLYNYICANRIIWGATEVRELKIRHTSGGPFRFALNAIPALRAYSEGSTKLLEDQVSKAQKTFPVSTADEAEKWLQERGGFGVEQAKVSVALAQEGGDTGSSGDPTQLWNLVQGATAYARGITHTDTRVTFEKQASKLLDLAA